MPDTIVIQIQEARDAYQLYLADTLDDPVLTRVEWENAQVPAAAYASAAGVSAGQAAASAVNAANQVTLIGSRGCASDSCDDSSRDRHHASRNLDDASNKRIRIRIRIRRQRIGNRKLHRQRRRHHGGNVAVSDDGPGHKHHQRGIRKPVSIRRNHPSINMPTTYNLIKLEALTTIQSDLTASVTASASAAATSAANAATSEANMVAYGAPLPIVTETTTARTLVLTDAQKWIRTTNASAVTVTVPPESSVSWGTGAEVIIEQAAAGQVTLAPGSGVTLNTTMTLKSAAQYSVISIKRVGIDVWTVSSEKGLRNNGKRDHPVCGRLQGSRPMAEACRCDC